MQRSRDPAHAQQG